MCTDFTGDVDITDGEVEIIENFFSYSFTTILYGFTS